MSAGGEVADGLRWSGNTLARTPGNVVALVRMADAAPELAAFAGGWFLDPAAVGSRGPYLTAQSPHGPVILKINLSDVEIAWATAIAERDRDLAPDVHGAGTFPGTGVRWLLQERAAGSVGTTRAGNRAMMNAVARLHLLARSPAMPAGAPGGHPEAASDLAAALAAAVAKGGLRGSEPLLARVEDDWSRLLQIVSLEWCHGDLHPGNVVRRDALEPGLLVGFHPRKAPWIFEAGWIAGVALVLDRKPLYRWLFDLLREAHAAILGTRLKDSDYELAVRLTAGWYALTCWSQQGADCRDDRVLKALVEDQVVGALEA